MARSHDGRKRTWRIPLRDGTTLEVATPPRATEKQVRRRGRVSLVLGTMLATVAFAAVAAASDVDVAVVDTTAPTGSVTLAPGDSGTVTINLSVTGSQAGTATFKVNRDWTLSGGTFTGSNPQMFTVDPRAGGTPATTFSTTGTVTIASGQADGTFTLTVGAFDITNSNSTGAKLEAGDASNYSVTVETPAPADTTSPVITPNVVGTLGDNGWYVSDVTVSWTVSDPESAISSSSGCGSTTIDSDTTGTTLTCTATSGGGTASESVTIKRDATDPTISGSRSPAANTHGWNNTDVTVTFTCNDATSGVASCGPNQTISSEGANQSASGTAVDNAGNTASTTVSGINIDKTAPSVDLVGGPADGGSYYFGFVPAAPTCTASDALSGLDGTCAVSGYGTSVGAHTVTASATDKAGNTATDSHSYTVLAWTLTGFFQPVDMGSSVWNTVKGGSTVPLKFRVFAGSTELTDTSVVASLASGQIPCAGGSEDPVEALAPTGGTSLRYDTDSSQFVYNWQTPRQPGKCYRVTMTTQDGSTLVAYFKLK